jgi:hypothetical protein
VSERVMPDLSRDLFVYEGETAHNVSKFLGGNGVITLATAGAGSAGAAGSGARVLQVTGLVARADGTMMAVPVVLTVTQEAVAGTVVTVSTVGAVAGSVEQSAHLSVASGPSGGGAAPRRGPTSDDTIAEEMGPGHFEDHGDPSSWKYLGKMIEPATEMGREAGSKKVYEVFLDENGKQIEWHYWVNPDGTVEGGKLVFPGRTGPQGLAN